jgi:mono/diheme cytochrome c family protein
MRRSIPPPTAVRRVASRIHLRFVVGALGVGACARAGGPSAFSESEFPAHDAGAGIVTSTPPPVAVAAPLPQCTPVQSSDPLPARTTIVGAAAASASSATYFTADLFGLFKSVCGGCHVESNLGGFSVSETTFPMLVTRDVYNSEIVSDDPSTFMPPPAGGGIPYSQRAPTDAVVELATLLNDWLEQGSPAYSFTLPSSAGETAPGYALTAELGAELTNIGSCVPNRAMLGTDPSTMDKLDAMFASAITLPATLDQTDLVTLDSAALAKSGVVSYAPTYPLWSDGAGKMRYVRVPRGQSIAFDKATQAFTIPPNTRFYKTFLKAVVDANGQPSYRKIETRLIVSRPDTDNPDGTVDQNALYGTYVWNDDESQATLLNEPLRDGKPFADKIFEYVTDEAKAAPIIAGNPANLQNALDSAGLTRHYAVPGSERCVQCHMGSPSHAFVLGFTPLQVARRATGTGGTYEAAAGDELTQLQRLIDYGVISGMASPADVLALEKSEGTRQPRNDAELAAQAYMVGNCAHCHNPRGLPSVKQPALKDVLVFLPGPGPNQGIFQFPLETMSPIRKRGLNQDVPIPYITPSLYDMPSDSAIGKFFCPDAADPTCKSGLQWVLAPWRSLIYRNTDTPYDYFDDYAPFPHMPLNTSGYDCRVAGLMGDWMVSIPSRVKNPNEPQDLIPDINGFSALANVNADPQPYQEALPTDPDYETAVAAAKARLDQYHQVGFRYGFCPTTYTADIIDPIIEDEAENNLPVASDVGAFTDPMNPSRTIMPELTPIRPHYVSFDDTDPAGDWFPRRPDWETALVNPDVPTFVSNETASDDLTTDAAEDLTNVLDALGSVTLSDDIRTELLNQVPFGLWDTSVPGCDFSGVPRASSFTGADRPQWMIETPPAADAPVFVESAGAAVFTTVCFNCHGIEADSNGLLADEITNLTGGSARVANLRDGLFGPEAVPDQNRQRVFGPDAATLGIGADDLAARYVAWMTLGGTQKHLPQDVLNEVSLSPVVGTVRSHLSLQGTPDMLRLGLQLCEQIAGADPNVSQLPLDKFVDTGAMGWSRSTGLVDTNGDAEMWLRLCNLHNRPIVRVPIVPGGTWTATTSVSSLFVSGLQLYWAADSNGEDLYGPNPVMDHTGNVQMGVTSSNLFPICVRKPTSPTELANATHALSASPVLGKNAIPFCPDGFLTADRQLAVDTSTGQTDFKDGRKWAARGAINAALAVFLYLDQIERDPSKRQPLYTQCNLIAASP